MFSEKNQSPSHEREKSDRYVPNQYRLKKVKVTQQRRTSAVFVNRNPKRNRKQKVYY